MLAPTPEQMRDGLQAGLTDRGVVVTMHECDSGQMLINIAEQYAPFPASLAIVWWYGIKWKKLPRGKRMCLEEGWCCSAPAMEGYQGEHPVPTVQDAVAKLRDLLGWHRMYYPLKQPEEVTP